MKLVYKIVITLVTLIHIIFAFRGIFMPETVAEEFGFEFGDAVQKISIHIGLFAMIFSGFLLLATYWTFKGRREGMILGLVGGGGMLLSGILDYFLVDQPTDVMLLISAVIVVVTAYLALKAHNPSAD